MKITFKDAKSVFLLFLDLHNKKRSTPHFKHETPLITPLITNLRGSIFTQLIVNNNKFTKMNFTHFSMKLNHFYSCCESGINHIIKKLDLSRKLGCQINE